MAAHHQTHLAQDFVHQQLDLHEAQAIIVNLSRKHNPSFP